MVPRCSVDHDDPIAFHPAPFDDLSAGVLRSSQYGRRAPNRGPDMESVVQPTCLTPELRNVQVNQIEDRQNKRNRAEWRRIESRAIEEPRSPLDKYTGQPDCLGHMEQRGAAFDWLHGREASD